MSIPKSLDTLGVGDFHGSCVSSAQNTLGETLLLIPALRMSYKISCGDHIPIEQEWANYDSWTKSDPTLVFVNKGFFGIAMLISLCSAKAAFILQH